MRILRVIKQFLFIAVIVLLQLISIDFVLSKDIAKKKPVSTHHVTFDNLTSGKYAGSRVQLDWRSVKFEHCDRAQVVSRNGAINTKGNALRVSYPARKIGSEKSGAQFRVRLKPQEAYSLEYYVRFGHGNGSHWDFSRGGKLPGLGGGRCNTGGKKATGDGWTVRYMWRENGELFVYLYHLDQKKRYGDYIPLHVTLKAGRWYQLTQHIQLNEADQKNGILQVWIDGQLKLNRKNIRYRSDNHAPVDHFVFDTFYGGSTSDWGPRNDSLAYFDEIRIQPNKITRKRSID